MPTSKSIGVFDSGYGGLTILKELVALLPQLDFTYLGDNARAPYGNRSFESVYHYSLQCVQWLFQRKCPLVIVACNTASAKALRTIQQHDLPRLGGHQRVLGVIRPSTEIIGTLTRSGSIGLFATTGTVLSDSYGLEIRKFFPGIKVYQQSCPMWVPLIENNEHNRPGADYFVQEYTKQLLSQSAEIDVVLLACTHYPLMQEKIAQYLPASTQLVAQGAIVANSLVDYLNRHPEIAGRITQNAHREFFTTDATLDFDSHAKTFFGQSLHSTHVDL